MCLCWIPLSVFCLTHIHVGSCWYPCCHVGSRWAMLGLVDLCVGCHWSLCWVSLVSVLGFTGQCWVCIGSHFFWYWVSLSLFWVSLVSVEFYWSCLISLIPVLVLIGLCLVSLVWDVSFVSVLDLMVSVLGLMVSLLGFTGLCVGFYWSVFDITDPCVGSQWSVFILTRRC